jgi:RNA polymerase sigma-70 factor (ECF subfamily)
VLLDASVTFRLIGLADSKQGTAESIEHLAPTAQISDEDLISQISAGSREALALLFRRYAHQVYAISRKILRNEAEADDFLQDIFLGVRSEAGKFDTSKGSARSWILGMAFRRALSRRRYLSSRHFYTQLDIEDAIDRGEEPRTDPGRLDELIDQNSAARSLEEIFQTLSENQRQTLRLFFIEGDSFEEIAEKLGQSRGNIKHHYFRALEKLRKELFGSKLPGERAI